MSYNREQFENLIRRTLAEMGEKYLSDSAVNLLLGTAATESKFGTYLRQVGGPALGAFQMESATYGDLFCRYAEKVDCVSPDGWGWPALEWDLHLAIVMARLKYWDAPDPLPATDDIEGMARYWKRVWNTNLGKGTIEKFIEDYKTYVQKQ